MTSISKSLALVAVFAPWPEHVLSEPVTSALCPPMAWVTVDGAQFALPADVAANVRYLQSFGPRYARAVALVIATNARPDWRIGPDCPAPQQVVPNRQ